MLAYALRRLAWSIVVVWFVVSAAFAMLMWLPADPARTLVGPHGDAETMARAKEAYCLDGGFVTQYGCYVGRIAGGDLGLSFRTDRPVSQVIAQKIWPTAQLALAAMFLQLLIAIPLGALAAARRNRPTDYVISTMAAIGQGAPAFFVGLVLMYLYAFRTGWFPISGYGEGFWDRLHHLALPAITLALVGSAYYTRVVRGETLEALRENYIRTARAKGLPERQVVMRHGLRNSLIPVVTLLGLQLGTLMGGAVVIESIFAWPGLGREVLNAIIELDVPVVLGVVLFTSLAIVAANLLVDLAYAWLDPRVRLK